MQTKLITLSAALAVLAVFIVTPAASASPVLTENGTAVAVGSSITLKNTGNIFFTGATTLACESIDLKGTVTKSSGTEIEVQVPIEGSSFSGTGPNGDCTSSLSPFRVIVTSKLCFRTNGGDTIQSTGCGGSNRFTLEFTSLGTCKYHAASIAGKFVTGGDATFGFSKQPYDIDEGGGGAFCPNEGQLDMDLDLTTTDGTTLLIS